MKIWVQLWGAHISKILAAKKYKIRRDFGQLQTSISNMSGMDDDIYKRKTELSTTVALTFGEEDLLNFSPLTRKFFRG